MKTIRFCLIAALHAARDLRNGSNCECFHCVRECDCEDAQ